MLKSFSIIALFVMDCVHVSFNEFVLQGSTATLKCRVPIQTDIANDWTVTGFYQQADDSVLLAESRYELREGIVCETYVVCWSRKWW